jgi:hypothetical protein
MPLGDSQLAALIDGKLGTLSVNPPSTNFPVGKGYRLNLVKSSTELNSILAQSPKFEIAAAVVSSSAAGISGQNTLWVLKHLLVFFCMLIQCSAGTNTAAAGNAAGNTANNVPASATVGTTAGLVGTTSPLNPQATTGAALSLNARFSAAALAVVGAIAFTLWKHIWTVQKLDWTLSLVYLWGLLLIYVDLYLSA